MSLQATQGSLLVGDSANYIADLYASYLKNPKHVDPSWAEVFSRLDDDAAALLSEISGASWAPRTFEKQTTLQQDPATVSNTHEGVAVEARQATLDALRAVMLIRSHRVRGHLEAKLDPLGLKEIEYHSELDPKSYGFSDEDMDRPIFVNGQLGRQTATLGEICDLLQETYKGSIGAEFMHMQDPEQKDWILARIEDLNSRKNVSLEQKLNIFNSLTEADTFARFLGIKYPGAKRFGIEGAESLIPCLHTIISRGAELGVDEYVFGMAHRGRLSVLTNVIGKSIQAVLSEFQDKKIEETEVQGSGDVKYHLGCSAKKVYAGKEIRLSLTPNPSHLEAVNPVVVGKVRAKQKQQNDYSRSKVVGILIHGDAAFAGQGLVAETLMLSGLPGYRTGGTIHVVVNNQIGFTTSPAYSRSSPYCSDVAKMIQAPIFHVNGDDPEAVAYVAKLAMDFRNTFKHDVVIDMFCYRRYGHNEIDEPSFTQPEMYKAIAKKATTRQLYADQLVAQGIMSDQEAQEIEKQAMQKLQHDFDNLGSYVPAKADWLDGVWSGINVADEINQDVITGVSLEALRDIAKALVKIPSGFSVHRRLLRVLEEKAENLLTEENIDWATAEALAFGSLLKEGSFVRLSGQDSGRGTFSQRHSVLTDQNTEAKHIPLNNICEDQAEFEVIDSPLSEAAVLGFEYGYSTAEPNGLIMWEAQFGDFANGAQVIFDQFLSSSEAKWLRMSGLTVLLPHGYEGQGPEHSSARLERYLQLSAENNWQVLYPSTPANFFHALRRQLRRTIRKPMIVMTPKSLLRNKLAVSSFIEMGPGSSFQPVLSDPGATRLNTSKVKRIVVCSGKIFYDLYAEREARGIKDVAIVRVEQLYPFPTKALESVLRPFKSAQVLWCQEEPQNQGAWHYIDRRLEEVLFACGFDDSRPIYLGRTPSAATATGFASQHAKTQAQLVDRALSLD